MNKGTKIGIYVGIPVAIVAIWFGYSWMSYSLPQEMEYQEAKEMSCTQLKSHIDYKGYGGSGVQKRIFELYEFRCGEYEYPEQEGPAKLGPTIVG